MDLPLVEVVPAAASAEASTRVVPGGLSVPTFFSLF